jgi:hypothetical protein
MCHMRGDPLSLGGSGGWWHGWICALSSDRQLIVMTRQGIDCVNIADEPPFILTTPTHTRGGGSPIHTRAAIYGTIWQWCHGGMSNVSWGMRVPQMRSKGLSHAIGLVAHILRYKPRTVEFRKKRTAVQRLAVSVCYCWGLSNVTI